MALSSSQHLRRKRKIAVLGSRSVGRWDLLTAGKSSLVVRYVEDAFVDSYYPTIENVFEKTIRYKGQDFDCDIVDTAGQDEYSILNSKHAIGIHGYVLVYSIASRASFEMIQTVYDKILNYTGTSTIPCVLVGQKSDLHSQRYATHSRQASAGGRGQAARAAAAVRVDRDERASQCERRYVVRLTAAKVFELVLAEIEKASSPGGAEPQPSKCVVM